MFVLYFQFPYGHVVRFDEKQTELEAIKLANFHAEYCGVKGLVIQVYAAGKLVHEIECEHA
jgi:hypothetical protein